MTALVIPQGPVRPLKQALLVDRPNRFTVVCRMGRSMVRAHLPNPGRLTELLLPGAEVLLRPKTSPGMDFKCVAVMVGGSPVVLDTLMANKVARELVQAGKVPGLQGFSVAGSEVGFGRSRIDFLLRRRDGTEMLLEVKSCTLFGERCAMFPDAVTSRGRKHVLELAGHRGRAGILFVIQSLRPDCFLPNYHTDPDFSRALLDSRRELSVSAVAVEWMSDLSAVRHVKVLRIPWDVAERESKDRGAYLLVMQLDDSRTLGIGSLGDLAFERGYYVYIGSAMANLTSRIQRHKRKRKKKHWHVDYLRHVSRLHSTWAVRTSARIECELASAVREIADSMVKDFGSSDCHCPSHLFYFRDDPAKDRRFVESLTRFMVDGPVSGVC